MEPMNYTILRLSPLWLGRRELKLEAEHSIAIYLNCVEGKLTANLTINNDRDNVLLPDLMKMDNAKAFS